MALRESLKMYRRARDQWAALASSAKDVYKSDISFGEFSFLRGHWLDRLPAIDEDIAYMTTQFEKPKQADHAGPTGTPGKPSTAGQPNRYRAIFVRAAIAECLGGPTRRIAACHHTPPKPFKGSAMIDIELEMDKALQSVILYYRHVNQAERYKMTVMEATGNRYHAVIPADYSDSPYPLQYYFELKYSPSSSLLYPGLGVDRKTQPYFVIRKG